MTKTYKTIDTAALDLLRSPADMLPELFAKVALANLFADPKVWADATYKASPETILEAYQRDLPSTKAGLSDFVAKYFSVPTTTGSDQLVEAGSAPASMLEHIEHMWGLLSRNADAPDNDLTLLPLERSYVVPGGRFREVYYWDSYFTMLGLGETYPKLLENMVKNFADQIALYGFIPNGNRSYYLSRSQPPLFYKMVGLTCPDDPKRAYSRYLTEMKREHLYWSDAAVSKPRYRIKLDDGHVLNRYYDARDVPRDECFFYDHETAESSPDPRKVYKDLRSGAESGWDYSSRWLGDGHTLSTIRTTSILPICLNAILYGLEVAISEGCMQQNDIGAANHYREKAKRRCEAIDLYLWDDEAGMYRDYDFIKRAQTPVISAAIVYPLFFGCASQAQADRVAAAIEESLLEKGGLNSTLIETGQQWDSPNGWAPLQYLAVTGLETYGHMRLARTIRERWMETVKSVYDRTGQLFEKYNVLEETKGEGGEYDVQPGFGWTNGVAWSFLHTGSPKGLDEESLEMKDA